MVAAVLRSAALAMMQKRQDLRVIPRLYTQHLATALVLEGCETGRRLESIIAAEKALRTDPRCPEAMLVVMDQDEVRQLVSSDYVRLGLSKAVLDESERRLNRGKRRPDVEDPAERKVMESAFRRAAKAYAACLSELGHHGEASHVYSSLTNRSAWRVSTPISNCPEATAASTSASMRSSR